MHSGAADNDDDEDDDGCLAHFVSLQFFHMGKITKICIETRKMVALGVGGGVWGNKFAA